MTADRDQKGPTTTQVIALVTLIPIGGSLLGLAGITLVGTLIGLAVATPVFVICSPVLVPAAIMLAGAVAGFLASGTLGLTGLSSVMGKQRISQSKFAQIGL